VSKHTPTPWEARKYTAEGDYAIARVGYMPIAAMGPEEDRDAEQVEADAEFIVRAVNSHDDLLEACKEVLRIRDCKLSAANGGWSDAADIWAKVDAAIAKAQGG